MHSPGIGFRVPTAQNAFILGTKMARVKVYDNDSSACSLAQHMRFPVFHFQADFREQQSQEACNHWHTNRFARVVASEATRKQNSESTARQGLWKPCGRYTFQQDNNVNLSLLVASCRFQLHKRSFCGHNTDLQNQNPGTQRMSTQQNPNLCFQQKIVLFLLQRFGLLTHTLWDQKSNWKLGCMPLLHDKCVLEGSAWEAKSTGGGVHGLWLKSAVHKSIDQSLRVRLRQHRSQWQWRHTASKDWPGCSAQKQCWPKAHQEQKPCQQHKLLQRMKTVDLLGKLSISAVKCLFKYSLIKTNDAVFPVSGDAEVKEYR